jgi:hypothetical protein
MVHHNQSTPFFPIVRFLGGIVAITIKSVLYKTLGKVAGPAIDEEGEM